VETFVQSVVSGVLTGSLYAMIGVGLTVVFGVMRIINLAHGASSSMLGMYGAFWAQCAVEAGPFRVHRALGAADVSGGMLVYRFLLRPIIPGGELNTLLYTAGLSLLIANLALFAWTGDYRDDQAPLRDHSAASLSGNRGCRSPRHRLRPRHRHHGRPLSLP